MNHWTPPAPGPCVLGVRIREPLTLGHVLLLAELGSPIVLGGAILPGDIALAVFVTAQPHTEARKDVERWWAPLLMRWWGRRMSKRDFTAEADAFVEWFVESSKSPAFWRQESASNRECAAPWWINRLALAMGNLGMSYADAVNMPLKTLGQLTMAFSEARGEVQLVSRREAEFHELVARLEAQKRN